MKIFLAVFVILLFSAINSYATGHATNYTTDNHSPSVFTWPELNSCNNCLDIELSNIVISVPPQDLKRLEILNIEGISFALEANNNWLETGDELIFLLLNESNTTGGLNNNGFFEKFKISNLDDFFKHLHQNNGNKEETQIARKIMGVEKFSEFYAYRKNSMSAYWISGNDKNHQSLYIIPKDKNYSLQISGALSKKIVQKLLSSIDIKKQD